MGSEAAEQLSEPGAAAKTPDSPQEPNGKAPEGLQEPSVEAAPRDEQDPYSIQDGIAEEILGLDRALPSGQGETIEESTAEGVDETNAGAGSPEKLTSTTPSVEEKTGAAPAQDV